MPPNSPVPLLVRIRATAPGEPSPRHCGFTLVEMLIVIAGIAILTAILFSVGAQVTSRSKSAKCAQHLRQIWMAISLYGNDHRGRIPGPSYQGLTISNPSVPAKLLPYTGNSDAIWDCPARPKLRQLRGYTGYMQGSVYIAGAGTQFPFGYPSGSGPEKQTMTLREISQLADPSQCWLLTELDAQNYSTPGLEDYAPGPAHDNGRNVLYHDGRVVHQLSKP